MKLAIQIMCYTVAILMFLGVMVMASEGSLEGITFITFLLLEAQSILTLIYVSDVDEE